MHANANAVLPRERFSSRSFHASSRSSLEYVSTNANASSDEQVLSEDEAAPVDTTPRSPAYQIVHQMIAGTKVSLSRRMSSYGKLATFIVNDTLCFHADEDEGGERGGGRGSGGGGDNESIGDTPLFFGIGEWGSPDSPDCVKLVLTQPGVEPNASLYDEDGVPALAHAAAQGKVRRRAFYAFAS